MIFSISEPSPTPTTGDMFYDPDLAEVKVYSGTEWVLSAALSVEELLWDAVVCITFEKEQGL